MLVALPPAIVSIKNASIEAFFSGRPNLAIACSLWPVVLLPLAGLSKWLGARSKSVSLEHLIACNQALDQMVGNSVDAWGKEAAAVEAGASDGSHDRLVALLDFDRTAGAISNAVWSLFAAIRDSASTSVHVAIARMKDGFIESFAAYSPSDEAPHGLVARLQDPESGYSRAVRKNGLLVIEDTKAEREKRPGTRRYISVGDDLLDGDGSIILCPIRCNRLKEDVPFVLSVWVGKRRYFNQDQARNYQFLLDRFTKLIVRGHYMELLRNGRPTRGAGWEN